MHCDRLSWVTDQEQHACIEGSQIMLHCHQYCMAQLNTSAKQNAAAHHPPQNSSTIQQIELDHSMQHCMLSACTQTILHCHQRCTAQLNADEVTSAKQHAATHECP